MPAQRFAQNVRGVATDCTGFAEVVIEGFTEVRVHTVVDDHSGALAWRQTAQVGQTLFGYQNVHIVFGVSTWLTIGTTLEIAPALAMDLVTKIAR